MGCMGSLAAINIAMLSFFRVKVGWRVLPIVRCGSLLYLLATWLDGWVGVKELHAVFGFEQTDDSDQ